MSSSLRLLCAGLLLMPMLAGCVVGSPGTTSTGGGGSHSAAANPVAIKVDGRDIKLDELLSSALIRDQLRDFIAIEHLRKEASDEGVKADQAALDKKVEDQKKQVANTGAKWEDFLFSHSVTEQELRNQMEFGMILDAMAAKRATLTDDQLKDEYNKDKSTWDKRYANEHYLTDAQAKEVTFDKIKDWLRQTVSQDKKMSAMQDLYYDAIKNTKVEFPVLGDAKAQDKWVNLIVRSKLPPNAPNQPGGGQGAPGKQMPAPGGNSAPPSDGKTPPPATPPSGGGAPPAAPPSGGSAPPAAPPSGGSAPPAAPPATPPSAPGGK